MQVRRQVAQSVSVVLLQVKLMQGDIELADDMPLPRGQTLQALLKHVEPELFWYPAGKYSYKGKDVISIRYSESREVEWSVCFTDGTSLRLDDEDTRVETSEVAELIGEWGFVRRDLHYSTKDVSYYDEREYTPCEDPAEWESYSNGHHRGERRKPGCDWWEAIRAKKAQDKR